MFCFVLFLFYFIFVVHFDLLLMYFFYCELSRTIIQQCHSPGGLGDTTDNMPPFYLIGSDLCRELLWNKSTCHKMSNSDAKEKKNWHGVSSTQGGLILEVCKKKWVDTLIEV